MPYSSDDPHLILIVGHRVRRRRKEERYRYLKERRRSARDRLESPGAATSPYTSSIVSTTLTPFYIHILLLGHSAFTLLTTVFSKMTFVRLIVCVVGVYSMFLVSINRASLSEARLTRQAVMGDSSGAT